MVQDCIFDKAKDIAEVQEGLSIDLAEAIKGGFIPSTGVDGEYNLISDPALISGRIEDSFDAVDRLRNYRSAAAKAKAEAEASKDVTPKE